MRSSSMLARAGTSFLQPIWRRLRPWSGDWRERWPSEPLAATHRNQRHAASTMIEMYPMKETEAQGTGTDRKDCMRQFRAAWDRFSSDPARLTEFLEVKRQR